jgi:hypothetical protein
MEEGEISTAFIVEGGIIPPPASSGLTHGEEEAVAREIGDTTAPVRTVVVTSDSARPVSPSTDQTPPSASLEPSGDVRTDSAEIDISAAAVQSSGACRIHTSVVADRDAELIRHGALWEYLDRIAQYDGHVRDIYDLCGPYKHST